jgi:hypothetical protein
LLIKSFYLDGKESHLELMAGPQFVDKNILLHWSWVAHPASLPNIFLVN